MPCYFCRNRKKLGTPCVHNSWIPDGSKDMPADRNSYRRVLKKSLDEALVTGYPKEYMNDAVVSKLFRKEKGKAPIAPVHGTPSLLKHPVYKHT